MHINFRGGWKDVLLLIMAFLLFLAVLMLPVACAFAESAKPVFRMHVVAHSDSPRDQLIKYHVRDAVMEQYGSLLSHAAQNGLEELEKTVQLLLSGIERTAANAARSLGFQEAVEAKSGRMQLSAKKIGNETLPSGEYPALVITLGSGEGQNWWCILFPELSRELSHHTLELLTEGFHWKSADIFRFWFLFDK